MIDAELNTLARALIAASDRLDSQDFRDRQARYLEIEAERNTLAESLEADEAAVVRAQAALQAHLDICATHAAPKAETPADDPSESTVDVEEYFRPIFGAEDVNEFSSSRATYNGAYTED